MPEFSPDYCPDCGTKLETRHIDGRERLWCSNCEQVEWLNPSICAGLIIQKEDKFLLQKRGIWPRKGTWSIPAGFLELEETPLEAAKRETLEETGLKVEKDPKFVKNISIENPDENRVIVSVYYIDYQETSGELSAENDEVKELRFWRLSEIKLKKELIEHEKYLDLIKKVKKN